MSALGVTSFTGWFLVLLIALTISLPFVLRRTRFLVAWGGGSVTVRPYLHRLRPHYLLGYGVTGIVVAHAWIPMSAGFGGHANALGLYLGTGALFALIGQVLVGRSLQDPRLPERLAVRRFHRWLMLGIVLLALGHILLTSPTLHLFTH